MDKFCKKIINNAKKVDKLFKENSKLEELRQKLAIKKVKNDKLFKQLTWEVEVWKKDIRLLGSYEGNKKPEIFNILRDRYGSYHYQINLEPGVTSNFDDDEIRLTFEDISYIAHFAKEWGIEISTKNLSAQMNEAQNTVDKILKIFNVLWDNKIEAIKKKKD